jgi:hypothetical protein
MNFSIVLASRERVGLLTDLIKSVKENTTDISNVEMLVAIDNDDHGTREAAKSLMRDYPFVHIYNRPRSSMLNNDYLNWVYSNYGCGRFAIVCNDDCAFRTKDWDGIALRKLNNYLHDKPDGIVYGYLSDALINRNGMNYCCFPLLSRKGYEVLGWLMPPEYPSWNADIAIWKVYRAANRICDLSDIMVEHIAYHSNKRARDHISYHVQQLSDRVRHEIPMEPNMQKLIEAIAESDSKKTLIEKVTTFYRKVISYHDSVRYDPRMDVIWSNNMTDMVGILMKSKSAEELIDYVDQTFMYAINFPPENGENTGVWKRNGDHPRIREKQINWLLNKLTFDLFAEPEDIQESQFIHNRNKTIRKGRTLSGNFLRTYSITKQIIKYIGKVGRVLEIGGGCGHLARTISLMMPGVKYTIVDLPETLNFSYTFISLNFPDKKCLYVTSVEEAKNVDQYDFVFVPAVFAEHLHGREYDLFVNTASMGEMRNDVIHHWMDFIQNKLKVNNLFTLNRFLNVIDDGHAVFRKFENECSTCYDHKWEILNWELEPIYTRCPFIDTLHSRYVEIIAKRPYNCTDLIARSNELLQDALDEDWFRLKNYYSGGIMQYRANVLVNDMTMSGALFKLWESIRLDQNKKNVSAMLEYIDRLDIDLFFEEKLYYQDLLARLN